MTTLLLFILGGLCAAYPLGLLGDAWMAYQRRSA